MTSQRALTNGHAPPHIRANSGSNIHPWNTEQSQISQRPRPPSIQQNVRSLMPQYRRRNRRARIGHGLTIGAQPYLSQSPAQLSEYLLPPQKERRRNFNRNGDTESVRSLTRSVRSTPVAEEGGRQASWSSNSSRRSSEDGAIDDDASRAPPAMSSQTVSEKYNIIPSAGLLLFPEDIEKDDWMHTPDPNDRDKMQCSDVFSKRGCVNLGGLACITIGVLLLFIGYPVLTFVQRIVDRPPSLCATNPLCLNERAPLLRNVRSGLIDPDTPDSAKSRTSSKGGSQKLVFSDEFNHAGRTFYNGDDPFWQAVDLWYGATHDIEWYDPDAITTQDGYLAIRVDAFRNHGLNYRSGMLQSWNKLCFKGGYMEASISLPGNGETSGFWPGFWAMGNLGRPGYLATTEGMWPYSYHDECDAGITANQSDPDGLSILPGMRLPACSCEGEDHPTPGLSRSAPEIDAIEASVTWLKPPVGKTIGSASQSFQVAPFDILWRPNVDFMEIYDRPITMINVYQGGSAQQAISAVTNLNNRWYDGNGYQKYAFEYSPGADGYVVWYVGHEKTWKIDGRAIGPNGNIGQRIIPEEPMSMIINFGMSTGFSDIEFKKIARLLPATMRIDYVRIYQDDDGEVTCDPYGHPTTSYIAQHPKAYRNPNMTLWEDTGYPWPRNSYVDDCKPASSYKEARSYKGKQPE